MRILTRYVLREFLIPFAYCMSGFVSIYVLFELFGSLSRFIDAKLPFGTAVEYMCAYLSPFFHYLVPAALMLATLYTMWNFCRHSEIIAMRANGISFLTIVKPLLAVAVLMAAAVWWVGDRYVPAKAQWGRQMKTVKFDMARMAAADNVVFRSAAGGRTWTIDKLAKPDASEIDGVKVTVDRPNGGARLMNVLADKAMYLDGEWWFVRPTVQHFDEFGGEVKSATPELDALTLRNFPEFRETPDDFLSLNRDWSFNSINDRLRYLRTHPGLSADTRRKYEYDTWAKIFAPLACLVITLFAIPAGIASGRQSVFRGILGALGMFFAYYGISIGCMILANLGWLPPIPAAVLPPIVFLLLGIRSFLKQR